MVSAPTWCTDVVVERKQETMFVCDPEARDDTSRAGEERAFALLRDGVSR